MPHVEDVAAAILERCGPLDTYQLQKLVYYAQAWNVTWRDERLFDEDVEAWDDGPCVRRLFGMHRRARSVSRFGKGDAHALPAESAPIIDYVCRRYGSYSGDELSERVHREAPWIDAYAVGRNTVISTESMKDYYGKLPEAEQSWFWTPEWWSAEREATDDIASGRVTTFASDDDFLSSL